MDISTWGRLGGLVREGGRVSEEGWEGDWGRVGGLVGEG